jgi:nitrate/nitrite transporter NarK
MHKAERHALLTSLLVPITAVAVVVDAAWPLVPILFVVSPLAVLWLVWVVLNDTASLPPDLREDHEWDYLDRPDLMQRDTVRKVSP